MLTCRIIKSLWCAVFQNFKNCHPRFKHLIGLSLSSILCKHTQKHTHIFPLPVMEHVLINQRNLEISINVVVWFRERGRWRERERERERERMILKIFIHPLRR